MSTLESPMRIERNFNLRDGRGVTLRHPTAEDRGELVKFASALSEDSVYARFFTTGIGRDEIVKELEPKGEGFALVALTKEGVVGHVSFALFDMGAAEIGVVILDSYQGVGLGTAMIQMAASEANATGVSAFEAVISWSNTKMIELVRTMGFPTSERIEPELIRIRFPTSIDPISIGEFQKIWAFRAD